MIKLVEERRKGHGTERIRHARASSNVISPDVLGHVAPDSARKLDSGSARWPLALAAQLVRDLVGLRGDAGRASLRLATLALEGAIRFASAADRGAFTEELAVVVADRSPATTTRPLERPRPPARPRPAPHQEDAAARTA
ncbi:MAG TPA: hypothetical protein VNN74_00975 [Candidatus Micrarchaeia archaeon]|nr:hypothetical protein [Candidatus Micrarchaeia archaeon]